MKITKKSRNLILFMILGDGYLDKNGSLKIRHCIKQKDYLEWKKKLLNKVGINTSDLVFIEKEGKQFYELSTYNHEFIKQMRKYVYCPYKNISNIKILKKLNSLGICIWYLDKGGLSYVKDKNNNIKKIYLSLNTMLSKDENQIIIDYFKNYWDISFYQVKCKNKYNLRCGTNEAKKMIKIIKPYLKNVNSMNYKFNIIP